MDKSKIFQSKGSLLHNRYLLYIVVIMSLINQISCALLNDLTTPIIFILTGLITNCFSKNMIVILVISLVASNIIKYGTKIRLNEGMTSMNDESDAEDYVVKPISKEKKAVRPEESKTTMDPSVIKNAKEKLRELQKIQSSLLSSIGSIDTHLKNADNAVNDLSEGFR